MYVSSGSQQAQEEDEDAVADWEATINPTDLYQRPKPAPPEWITEVLLAINEKRQVHWTPPLVWSELCYEYAKRQADTCMAKGKLSHGLNDTIQGRLGQCCLGPGSGGGPWRMNRKGTAEKIIDTWYNEKVNYRFDKPAHHEKSANFEQVVWFGTTSVGIALSKCGKYCVANFFPAGPDGLCEPPGEKGRRNYFPPGHPPSIAVIDLTNNDKYKAWFKTNVLPLQDRPAPWVAVVREESPSASDRTKSPDSPKGRGGGRSTSPKTGKAAGKTPKKGEAKKSGSRSSSRPGDTKKNAKTKEGEMRLMSPSRKSTASASGSRKSAAGSREGTAGSRKSSSGAGKSKEQPG